MTSILSIPKRSAAALVLAFLAAPNIAHACSVCYGAQGDPQTTGMTGAILALLGITGLVASGITALFLRIMLRARQSGTSVPGTVET